MSYPYRLKKHSHQPRRQRQQGVVIVVALFIVALVATMAYIMMSRLERDTRRTTLIMRHAQAELYAQGSIAWAQDTLRNNWENQKPNQIIDAIPIQSTVNEVNGYKIYSVIYDLQSRFNLNSLAVTEAQAAFKKLVQLADPKLSQEQTQLIVLTTMDWITPGSDNELTRYYTALPIPYRSAHRPMMSATELRMVKGMTPALFALLQPYVTALPAAAQINVQTAPAPVLAALSPTMTLDAARGLERARKAKPFLTNADFTENEIVKNHKIPPALITVTSNYFLVETHVAIEKQEAVIYTLMNRAVKERKAIVNILSQSKGIW